jgi:tRNA-binding EMAP/Myf-like protein
MKNENSVCYIAKIKEIKPIEGADNIELVVAGGWNAITKKGEFTIGDETIIATTDAVIPETLSEDMGVTNYLRKGNRVRTVKLRGVYSECLIIPMKHLNGRVTIGDFDLIVTGPLTTDNRRVAVKKAAPMYLSRSAGLLILSSLSNVSPSE